MARSAGNQRTEERPGYRQGSSRATARIERQRKGRSGQGFCQEITHDGRASWLAAVHDRGEDAHNPHAHIIIRDKDRETGKRVALLSEKGSTERIREAWERHANAALERAGSTETIDRRSLVAQGIDREATKHLGASEALAKKGDFTPRWNENEAIKARNTAAQRPKRDPLASYRQAVEKAESQQDEEEIAVSKAALAKAAELVERGERPSNHGRSIEAARETARTAWREEQDVMRAEQERQAMEEERCRNPYAFMSVSELEREVPKLEYLIEYETRQRLYSDPEHKSLFGEHEKVRKERAEVWDAIKKTQKEEAEAVEEIGTLETAHPFQSKLHRMGIKTFSRMAEWERWRDQKSEAKESQTRHHSSLGVVLSEFDRQLKDLRERLQERIKEELSGLYEKLSSAVKALSERRGVSTNEETQSLVNSFRNIGVSEEPEAAQKPSKDEPKETQSIRRGRRR